MSARANDSRRVNVLFAHRRSVYWDLPVEVFDERRDARSHRAGEGGPIIAHPPCRLWCRLRALSKAPEAERSLAFFALERVRMHGGVLEHPAHSLFWRAAGLPRPSRAHGQDEWGGWTLPVLQCWWGHRARKATWLYIVGCDPSQVPEVPFGAFEPTHTCGPSKAKRLAVLQGDDLDLTPVAFAWWLEELASRCRPGVKAERAAPSFVQNLSSPGVVGAHG